MYWESEGEEDGTILDMFSEQMNGTILDMFLEWMKTEDSYSKPSCRDQEAKEK